ncbi:MAG: hypothetical protein MJ252_24725 [archaeon]|nr:hypothetical protein [archaeon]
MERYNTFKIGYLIAVLSLIAGRLSESLEDTKGYVLEETISEKKNELSIKYNHSRELRTKVNSGCSDLYFLTSDDESFNKGIMNKYI